MLLAALNLDAAQKSALAEYNHNQQVIEPLAQDLFIFLSFAGLRNLICRFDSRRLA